MLKCDLCATEHIYRLTSLGKGVWACQNCFRVPSSYGTRIVKKVKLDSMWVTEAQIKEQDRRRILPYEHREKGSYYVGRMCENGKISEREPDFRS